MDILGLFQEVCKYASMKVCKYASTQVYKYASFQVCKYASMQVYKHASMQVGKYVGLQEYKKGVSGFFQGFQRHLYLLFVGNPRSSTLK